MTDKTSILAAKRIISSAREELGSAIAQSVPSDDQIIMTKVAVAHALLKQAGELLSDVAAKS